MRYRLLVVDDEENIRKGIIARLEYLNIQFEEIRDTSTSWKALEYLEQWRPDIVITDIQMPDMDGLTFIELAKKKYPRIKFIIVSGYTEFAYAERAISLQVNAYLVKPISNDQLKKAMNKVFTILQEETDLKYAMQMKEKLEYVREISQFESEINCLLDGTGSYKISKDFYPIMFKKYPQICREENYFYLALISIDEKSFEGGIFQKEEYELLRFSIKNIFTELINGCERIIVNNLNKKDQLYILYWGGR